MTMTIRIDNEYFCFEDISEFDSSPGKMHYPDKTDNGLKADNAFLYFHLMTND